MRDEISANAASRHHQAVYIAGNERTQRNVVGFDPHATPAGTRRPPLSEAALDALEAMLAATPLGGKTAADEHNAENAEPNAAAAAAPVGKEVVAGLAATRRTLAEVHSRLGRLGHAAPPPQPHF
jgi:hypothetical protein